MASWDDLVKVALLGTDQQPASLLAEPSAVGQLLEKIEASASRTREAQLLCAAGALAVHSRAGAVPATADFVRPEPPTSEDDVPTCSHVAASNLRLLIDQYSENLLPLWLSKLCEAQRRIPESFAPMLLEFALKESEYRHTVAQVIGHRGRWLAAQNPDWSFATENVAYSTAELTEVFNLGTPAQRVNAIAHLRLSDPKLARELVESTWKQDSHEVRGAFLDLFVNNLSMADEPFLEEIALPDRRKEIRALAALLLAQLPESRLHKRVLTKMLPSLKLQKVSVQESAGEKIAKMLPFLKSSTKAPTMSFSVDLPVDADAEMVRDGFTKPTVPKTAEMRKEWLVYGLSLVDPAAWEAKFGATAQELTTNMQIPTYVLEALMKSALAHENWVWAEGLAKNLLTASDTRVQFMPALPPEIRERVLLEAITQNANALSIQGTPYPQPIKSALAACRHDWSIQFSRAIIPALVAEARNPIGYDQPFSVIGYYFAPVVLSEVESAFRDVTAVQPDQVDRFFNAIRFKAQMYGDLQ